MRCFDTSFLAPRVLGEETSEKVEAFIARLPAGEACVSHWTRTEFARLLAREVGMKALAEADALAAMDRFDTMVAESFRVFVPDAADFGLATAYFEHFAAELRAGDALHLAIASNHGAKTFCTSDRGLLASAKLLKVPASRGVRPERPIIPCPAAVAPRSWTVSGDSAAARRGDGGVACRGREGPGQRQGKAGRGGSRPAGAQVRGPGTDPEAQVVQVAFTVQAERIRRRLATASPSPRVPRPSC